MTSPTNKNAPGTTRRIDLGSRALPGWYWLLSGRQRQPYEPRANAALGPRRHVYSYERSHEAIKEAALQLIDSAQDKIFLASFRFSDPDLRKALQRKARQLRGGVYVITSIREDDFRQTIGFTPSYEEGEEDWLDEADNTPPDGDKRTAQEIDDEENKKHYQALCRSGIWVRGHPEFHAKFLVVDDRAALVSSANLESTALVDAINRPGRGSDFDAVTAESGIVTTQPGDAQRLGRLFARLWQAECTFDAPASTSYQVSRRTPSPATVPLHYPPDDAAGPIWTGTGDRLILQALHQVCKLARHDLVLACFSTKNLDKEEYKDLLFDPVRAALDAGVRVRLLLRSRNSAETRRTAGLLASWGVDVYGDDKTHAKCAIADGRHGAIFSANFDAEHGIYSGTEVGMRLDRDPALADVAHFFDHAISCAPQRLVKEPAAAGFRRLASRGLHGWPFPSELTVIPCGQAWDELAATTGPVLFTTRDTANREVTLHADGGKWDLSGAGPAWRLTMLERPSPAPSPPGQPPSLLENWLAPNRRATAKDPYRGHRRGLCPAVLLRD